MIEQDPNIGEIKAQLQALSQRLSRPARLLELCCNRGHDVPLPRLDALLPDGLSLTHGPSCPVCATPFELVDRAVALVRLHEVTLCTTKDYLTLPGSQTSLQKLEAEGGNVRVVESALDALNFAQEHPSRQVVYFAGGFEDLAPMTAMAALQSRRREVENFSLLSAHLYLPALVEHLLGFPGGALAGVLVPAQNCTVTGYQVYEQLAEKYNVPMVVCGPQLVDLAQGLHLLVKELAQGHATVTNQYRRAFTKEGNFAAGALLGEVLTPCDQKWRGLGAIPKSGYSLKARYAALDAAKFFRLEGTLVSEYQGCLAQQIYLGQKCPADCPALGNKCTPRHPLGTPMAGPEGACAVQLS